MYMYVCVSVYVCRCVRVCVRVRVCVCVCMWESVCVCVGRGSTAGAWCETSKFPNDFLQLKLIWKHKEVGTLDKEEENREIEK